MSTRQGLGWCFRAPPENTDIFVMCNNPDCCVFGSSCTSAHSEDELKEWRVRRQAQLQKAAMTGQNASTALSNIQQLKDAMNKAKKQGVPQQNIATEVSGRETILCKQNLFVTYIDKNKEVTWEFTINVHPSYDGFTHGLQNVFFMEDNPCEFSLSGISLLQPPTKLDKLQEETRAISMQQFSTTPPTFARVAVKFFTSCYGKFNASLIFDFGYAPRVMKYLGVVVAPEKHLIKKLASEPSITTSKNNEIAWLADYKLVAFDATQEECVAKQAADKDQYTIPTNLQFGVDYGAFEHLDVELTRENYRDRLHTLLYVEEYERRKRMSRLNVHCEDLFALFSTTRRTNVKRDMQKTLFVPVAEETLEEVGILLSRGSKALLRIRQFVYDAPSHEDYVLHEALVVDILSDEIVLEISAKTQVLLESMASSPPVDICFRFTNIFLCMHSAIDRVNLDLIFNKSDNPTTERPVATLPHSVLSEPQTKAVSRILSCPPGTTTLLLGPFGTGKTQTLAEAVKTLMKKKENKPGVACRILICTHSNSAADHYIENYLHPVVEKMKSKDPLVENPVLRLYWEHRSAMSVSERIMPYCIMDLNDGTFRTPTLHELQRKTIVITTLVTADMLVRCDVKTGFFTHIFIDEAAQAMELETIIPISLANAKTRVVLAGDHLQLGPPIFSAIGRKLLLDKSLLVRLYESCPPQSPKKLLLLENFRSYKQLVDIPSKLFYGGSLVSNKISPESLPYPVQFFGIHGYEEKSDDSLSYVNMSEVAEVSERIDEIVNSWPTGEWGEIDLQKICVLCAHHAQIRQVRRELRVCGFRDVRVENVNNVQGLEFDVLLLSTVRTSCCLAPGQNEGKDLGLLSNPKLLNTAITRAKYSLIIIGDPKALCSVGDCRVCWKTILSLCNENETFHYRTSFQMVLDEIRQSCQQQPQQNITLNHMIPTPYNQLPLVRAQHSPLLLNQLQARTLHPLSGQPIQVPLRNLYRPYLLPSQSRLSSPMSPITVPPQSSPKREEQAPFNYDEEAREMDQTPSSNILEMLRRNIRTSLKTVLGNEDAVESSIEHPLEDAPASIARNLEEQLALIRVQRESLEKQQKLHRHLEETMRQWQMALQSGTDCEQTVSEQASSPGVVKSVKLEEDVEVCEWHQHHGRDPIVLEYIKAFEALSEQARSNARNKIEDRCMSEPYQTSSSTISDVLQGWVLQAKCAMYASGCSIYENYIPVKEALDSVRNGDLVSCNFAVDRSTGTSAKCAVDNPYERDICIPDRKSMNRAFNGDCVVVRITRDETDENVRYGKVVTILKERHRRQVVCRFSASDSSFMVPLNKTNPKFVVLQSENHAKEMGVAVFGFDGSVIKFLEFVSDVKDKLFLVQLLKWDCNYQYPLGFVVRCFDDCSKPSNLFRVLHADHGIDKDFPLEAIREVNSTFPKNWAIPEEERLSREVYDDAFTIDAEGAMELDDAVSVRFVRYGVYNVAVHVADVSYFVPKDSLLDKLAQHRASSIYLPEQFDSVPLLPSRLSTDICSLKPGEEKLAFTVVFTLDSNGNLMDKPAFHRSIVTSQQSFTYGEIDVYLTQGANREFEEKKMPRSLLRSLNVLDCLTQEIWYRRIRGGSLQAFSKIQEDSPSQRIVEELMLLANTAAAEKLSQISVTRAVPFRIHNMPKYHIIRDLAASVADQSIDFKHAFPTKWLSTLEDVDTENKSNTTVSINVGVWKSICQAIKLNDTVALTKAVVTLAENSPLMTVIAALERFSSKSKYVSSSQYTPSECRHFALNTECYTHFSSPIRRYLDIVVHRLLLHDTNMPPLYGDDELETLCNNLNSRSDRIGAFSKQCLTVASAQSIKEGSPWRHVIVDSPIPDYSLMLRSQDDKISLPVKLAAKQLGPSVKSWHEDVGELVVTWNFYNLDLQRTEQACQRDELRPKAKSESVSHTAVDVPSDLWCQLLDALREENMELLKRCEREIRIRAIVSSKSESSVAEDDGVSVSTERFGPSSVTRFFRRNDELRALYSCSFFNGLPQLSLQAVEIAPERTCCVQHIKKPAEVFAAHIKLSTTSKYSSVEQYQSIYLPLLRVESADSSIRACVSPLQLNNCNIQWTMDSQNRRQGVVDIPVEVLLFSTKVYKDDFICLRTCNAVHHGTVLRVDRVEHSHVTLQFALPASDEATIADERCTIEIIPQITFYRRMISAVQNLESASKDLRDLILNRDFSTNSADRQGTTREVTSAFTLGTEQLDAVRKAILSRFTVIEGLPGTGKSFTAAAIVEQFHAENVNRKSSQSNVLLCCPSEQAVDVVEGHLFRVCPDLPVVRVYSRGIEAQTYPEIGFAYDVRTDSTVDTISGDKALHVRIRSEHNPFGNKIMRCEQLVSSLTGSGCNTARRSDLYRALVEYRDIIAMAEEYELSQTGCKVVICTCTELGSRRMHKFGGVGQCVVDECNMCLEPECLIVLQSIFPTCQRLVLVGDRKQLGPPVHNTRAKIFGLGKSWFESLLDGRQNKWFSHHVLAVNYRMHPSISKICLPVSYDCVSKDSRIITCLQDKAQLNLFWPTMGCRVLVYNVCGDERRSDVPNRHGIPKQFYNEEEVKKVMDVIRALDDKGVSLSQISVLTPYTSQETLIKDYLSGMKLEGVKVGSFTSAQGSENEYIVISTVRSKYPSEIILNAPTQWLDDSLGVLADGKQTNVALSRARRGLIIIGNKELLGCCPNWSKFFDLCVSHGCVVSDSM